MEDELQQRLQQIETNLAHLEQQYDELNQVVVAQAKALAKLQAWQQRTAQSLEAAEIERIKATSAKPPHYQ